MQTGTPSVFLLHPLPHKTQNAVDSSLNRKLRFYFLQLPLPTQAPLNQTHTTKAIPTSLPAPSMRRRKYTTSQGKRKLTFPQPGSSTSLARSQTSRAHKGGARNSSLKPRGWDTDRAKGLQTDAKNKGTPPPLSGSFLAKVRIMDQVYCLPPSRVQGPGSRPEASGKLQTEHRAPLGAGELRGSQSESGLRPSCTHPASPARPAPSPRAGPAVTHRP